MVSTPLNLPVDESYAQSLDLELQLLEPSVAQLPLEMEQSVEAVEPESPPPPPPMQGWLGPTLPLSQAGVAPLEQEGGGPISKDPVPQSGVVPAHKHGDVRRKA